MENKNVKVIAKEGEEEAPIEVLQSSIIEISKAFKKISTSRISRETLVTLIHANANNVGKPSIRIVLEVLDDLENLLLKPKKK